MEKLSRFVLSHARAVVSTMVGVVLLGAASVLILLPNISEGNEYPGLPAYEANTAIDRHLGTGGYERPFLPVITLPEGTDPRAPDVSAQLAGGWAAIEAQTGARVAGFANTGDDIFIGDDNRTTFALVYGPRVEQGGIPGSALGEDVVLDNQILSALDGHLPEGSTVTVTGLDTLATGADAGGLNVPIKLGVTVLAALLVLGWVFRSALAAVPLLIAVAALPIAFLGLLVISPLSTVHETTLQMVPLLGVGIAVDYALILVIRWREERAHGYRGDDAVHRAMATSGHAIAFSSAAVATGLIAMLILPIPLLRSLALGGVAVAVASAAATLVLLPVLLAAAGRRLDRKPATSLRHDRREENAGRAWTSWARLVVRHRWVAAISSTALLLALGAVGLTVNLNVPESGHLSNDGPGRAGLTALQQAGVPDGVLTSFDVLVENADDAPAVADGLREVPGVAAVLDPDDPSWFGDGAAVVTVVPIDEGGTPAGRATVERVIAAAPDGTLVGGNVAQQMNYVDAAYGVFPWVLAAIALVTFVVLARAFRSVLLPLKAILANLLSLGAVVGAMVVLWQWGWGTEALFGVQADGTVGTFVPLTIFAFLFGLTMDYEVFILARMREEYDATGSTDEAVVRAIGRTGRLVSCAALILFFSFASMTTGGELDVAVFASGMALGLLIDATIIRSILLPATISLMGRWNWWYPFPSQAHPHSHADSHAHSASRASVSVPDSTARRVPR